jgi:hypothetical protein
VKPVQILLLIVLVMLGALLFLQLPELRRYLKLRSM